MRTASLSLLTILCLMLAVAPAMADTYSNGAFNGTNDAWTINFGFTVSDSFTLSGNPVNAFHFVYWDASASDLLTTADLQVGATSFGGSATTVAFSNTFLGTNQYGYNRTRQTLPAFHSMVGRRGLRHPEQCLLHLRLFR